MPPRIRNRATNVRGKLNIDPQSLAQFDTALVGLERAVREAVIFKALQNGGEVIQGAAEGRAPGPHIVTVTMTGAELLRGWKSGSKQGVKADGLYAVVGPDKDHWYYRFTEYGVKPHGVKRRKRTRTQQTARVARKKRSELSPSIRNARPVMSWNVGGRQIFARKVRGYAARPFLRPAVDSQGTNAIRTMADTLSDEIAKAL